jgi:hypothetical protein
MTMPAPNTQRTELPRPHPDRPMVTLLITDNLMQDRQDQTIRWVIGQPHPFVPEMTIRRMFTDHDGVEVYSAPTQGNVCIRDLIPMARIRLVQEGMSLDVFIDELDDAESDDDEEDEPEYLDEEPVPTNGPAAVTS